MTAPRPWSKPVVHTVRRPGATVPPLVAAVFAGNLAAWLTGWSWPW